MPAPKEWETVILVAALNRLAVNPEGLGELLADTLVRSLKRRVTELAGSGNRSEVVQAAD